MQMQILSTSAMAGLGKVLSFTDPVEGEPISSEFRTGETPLRQRAGKEIVVDYESGMCLLILYHEDTPLIFYLDRKVLLFPGVSFSVVPLGSVCSARIYLRSGDRLEQEEYVHPQLSAGTPLLRIDRIYTCFYQESSRDFYYRGERHIPYGIHPFPAMTAPNHRTAFFAVRWFVLSFGHFICYTGFIIIALNL